MNIYSKIDLKNNSVLYGKEFFTANKTNFQVANNNKDHWDELLKTTNYKQHQCKHKINILKSSQVLWLNKVGMFSKRD